MNGQAKVLVFLFFIFMNHAFPGRYFLLRTIYTYELFFRNNSFSFHAIIFLQNDKQETYRLHMVSALFFTPETRQTNTLNAKGGFSRTGQRTNRMPYLDSLNYAQCSQSFAHTYSCQVLFSFLPFSLPFSLPVWFGRSRHQVCFPAKNIT